MANVKQLLNDALQLTAAMSQAAEVLEFRHAWDAAAMEIGPLISYQSPAPTRRVSEPKWPAPGVPWLRDEPTPRKRKTPVKRKTAPKRTKVETEREKYEAWLAAPTAWRFMGLGQGHPESIDPPGLNRPESIDPLDPMEL